MRKHSTGIAAVIVAAMIVAVVLTTWQVFVWGRPKPDTEVRQAVAGIRIGHIAAVALSTWPRHLILTPAGNWSSAAKLPPEFTAYRRVVRNPRAISLLLRGLSEATIPVHGRIHSPNRIILLLKDGRTVGPFNFGAERKIDCFGPAFVEGLRVAGAEVPKL